MYAYGCVCVGGGGVCVEEGGIGEVELGSGWQMRVNGENCKPFERPESRLLLPTTGGVPLVQNVHDRTAKRERLGEAVLFDDVYRGIIELVLFMVLREPWDQYCTFGAKLSYCFPGL